MKSYSTRIAQLTDQLGILQSLQYKGETDLSTQSVQHFLEIAANDALEASLNLMNFHKRYDILIGQLYATLGMNLHGTFLKNKVEIALARVDDISELYALIEEQGEIPLAVIREAIR